MSETAKDDAPAHPRVFLVVVDDSEEMRVALRFAGQRARHTDGRVALFRAIEPVEFQHWMGVGELMREEARQEAEGLMERMSQQVGDMTGTIPITHLREGNTRAELPAPLAQGRTISGRVLGAHVTATPPAPLHP